MCQFFFQKRSATHMINDTHSDAKGTNKKYYIDLYTVKWKYKSRSDFIESKEVTEYIYRIIPCEAVTYVTSVLWTWDLG